MPECRAVKQAASSRPAQLRRPARAPRPPAPHLSPAASADASSGTDASWLRAFSDRLAIAVEPPRDANPQLLETGLDYRAVADDDDDDPLGRDRPCRRRRLRPPASPRARAAQTTRSSRRAGRTVTISLDRAGHRAAGLPATGQRERVIRSFAASSSSALNGRGRRDLAQLLQHLVHRFLRLVGLHRRKTIHGRWPRASKAKLPAPYDQCLSSRRFMLMRELNDAAERVVERHERDLVRIGLRRRDVRRRESPTVPRPADRARYNAPRARPRDRSRCSSPGTSPGFQPRSARSSFGVSSAIVMSPTATSVACSGLNQVE